MKKAIAALFIAGFSVLGFAQIAYAHDVTPTEGSQCTSPTTGEVKFTAQNMGSEVRSIHVFLNGVEVGSNLNFTGNGSKKVDITVPAGLTGDVTFTWSTDAVSHPPANIIINWDKPKCQPEVTTTTSVSESTTTTTVCDEENGRECGTTTTTTPQETTTTTTIPEQTTTTSSTTSTTIPFCVPQEGLICLNIDSTTTTVPQSTTTTTVVASSTTQPPAPSTTAKSVVPEEPTVTPSTPEELPHTGSSTGPIAVFGLVLLGGGLTLTAIKKFARN